MDRKKYYTYLLLTENNTYYCGYTDDIEKRYKKHLEGSGAKYTKANKPVAIVYLEQFETKSEAMKEEYRIKQLPRLYKETLVKNFQISNPILYEFSKTVLSSQIL